MKEKYYINKKTHLATEKNFVLQHSLKGNALRDAEISAEVERVISDDKEIAKTFNEFFVNLVPDLKFRQKKITKQM